MRRGIPHSSRAPFSAAPFPRRFQLEKQTTLLPACFSSFFFHFFHILFYFFAFFFECGVEHVQQCFYFG